MLSVFPLAAALLSNVSYMYLIPGMRVVARMTASRPLTLCADHLRVQLDDIRRAADRFSEQHRLDAVDASVARGTDIRRQPDQRARVRLSWAQMADGWGT